MGIIFFKSNPGHAPDYIFMISRNHLGKARIFTRECSQACVSLWVCAQACVSLWVYQWVCAQAQFLACQYAHD